MDSEDAEALEHHDEDEDRCEDAGHHAVALEEEAGDGLDERELVHGRGPGEPGRDDGDADHADRHADVGREVVEEVEEALAEDRHVRERAEAERAERAENGEDRARDLRRDLALHECSGHIFLRASSGDIPGCIKSF